MESAKLTRTVHSMATQYPPELVRIQTTKSRAPVASHASQTCSKSEVLRMKYMSGRRAKPAVSHSNTKMSANGFHSCVMNWPPSSHGYAARNSRSELKFEDPRGRLYGTRAACFALPVSHAKLRDSASIAPSACRRGSPP